MTSNNHSTSQGKSRGKFAMIIAAIAALAVLGLLLSQMDGRLAIVTSGATTATRTAASIPVISSLTDIAPTSIENISPSATAEQIMQGERLEMCESDICIVASDGRSVPLGLTTDYQIYPGFGFSPDGSKVVFNACLKTELQQNPAYQFCHDIFIADRNGNVSRLTNTYNLPESHPSWSPDGKWIAIGGWSLSIIRPDGTGLTTLISDTAVGNAHASAWSPNSEQIAFISGNHDFNINWGFQNAVFIINRDGSGWRKIFELPEPKPIQEDWITEIAWSPDGQSLAIAFHDGRAFSMDANCEAGMEGCRLSELTAIPEIPKNWLDTFYPQWNGAPQNTFTPTLNPQAAQARAFADPILQAIANRPPDFADDFSTNSHGWQIDTFDGQCGQIAQGRLITNIIPEQMTLQSDGRYTCGAHNPDVLNVTNFVFEVDLTQAQAEVQGFAGVQWRHTDGYYRVSVDVPGTHWTLAKSSTSSPGGAGVETLQEWEGPASGLIRVIGRGSQFAVYIDETPVFYIEDDLNPSGEIDLWLNAPDGSVAVEYDNLKLWNLDNVPELQSAETQARAFAEPILQAIANRPPDYEYDFNEPENGWISGVEESNTRGYVDGEYFVTVKPGGGTGAGPGPNFVFSDFVAELDARILKATDPGGWGFIFREQPFPQSFRYHINFNSSGLSLFLDTGSYTDLFYLQGAPVHPAPETNHLLVIAKGPNIAIYVNGEPVTVVNDTTLSSGIVSLGIHAGEQDTEVRFDNFKIWDISDLP